jgi:hypothetical protein
MQRPGDRGQQDVEIVPVMISALGTIKKELDEKFRCS